MQKPALWREAELEYSLRIVAQVRTSPPELLQVCVEGLRGPSRTELVINTTCPVPQRIATGVSNRLERPHDEDLIVVFCGVLRFAFEDCTDGEVSKGLGFVFVEEEGGVGTGINVGLIIVIIKLEVEIIHERIPLTHLHEGLVAQCKTCAEPVLGLKRCHPLYVAKDAGIAIIVKFFVVKNSSLEAGTDT